MILNLAYTNRSFSKSNQVRSRPIYLSGMGANCLYTRDICHLVNTLTFTDSIFQNFDIDKAFVYIKKKS